jgi:GAF domain-containing protein/HAMP domain-containing protein
MKITTRLILSFLIMTILPLAVMGYAGLRVMDRISIVALEGTTKGLKQMAEGSIHQQALSVAQQVELYLEAHPELLTAPAKELEANKELAALAVQPVGKTGYTALYDSDAITHFHTNSALIGADLHTLASTLPEFWRILEASLSGTPVDGYYKWKEADGSLRDKYMSCVPVGKTHFRVAATTYIDEFFQPIQSTRTEITGISQEAQRSLFIAMGVSGVITVLVATLLAMIFVRPLKRVTEGARRFSKGKLDQEIHLGGKDEIGELAATLDQMARELGKTVREKDNAARQLYDLNQRQAQQVAQLERRTTQIAAVAEISHVATTLLDPDPLVTRAVELIQERFNLYYAGLFLLDANKRYAILEHGTGEAGQVMKERGHRLEVGSQSMVGWACANKQARIALDVGQDAVRFANPLLPDTRSEMALPLRAGERVIGALDVQSTQVAAFDESDIAALQGMADQVAVALENARLFQQTQAALKEIEATNRLLVREGWQGYLEQKTTRRAEFSAASGPVPAPLQGKEAPQTEPLTIPLELRGQPLGRLTLRREGNRAWSEDETQLIQTIAMQTVLAAENARLIEETQRTLGETRALYETSRQITSAGVMSEVLSAVLDNLARTGIHAAAVALFDAPTREQAKNIELAGTWDYTGTPRLAPGVRFEIASFPLFGRVTSEKALVSQDLLSDPAIDEMAKAVLGGLGLRAMAITPLVARGQWMGVLFALMETAHTFTPSELNFHRALADQAAVAIDSRRLLAETQRRAEREQLIRQITTRIRGAGDIQGVLETTANELARSMGVSRSIVRLTTGNSA